MKKKKRFSSRPPPNRRRVCTRREEARRTANGKHVQFAVRRRSRARTTDKSWEANELIFFICFFFVFFFNSSTAVTACRTWTPISSQLLIQVLEVVMAAHPGSFFLSRQCGEKNLKRLDSRQDGARLRRYSVQRRRSSNDLARAASLI